MHYSQTSDETLVTLTLAGDADAYEELVKRHQTQVLIAANTVIHNTYLAEDAAQDAFVSAWMKLNVLREPSKYGTWVCRIAKNCARNMLLRMREYISFDLLENMEHEGDENTDDTWTSSEEHRELHDSIERLPQKIRTVIILHYFEGLSIAQIASRMKSSEGTVKWQLHDGRQKLRKELGAMDEKKNDTLVRKVMKKVDELKLWRLKQNKTGFEAVYRDVLQSVEALPESADRSHALADVLMHGWWWIPDKKNDALLDRIKQAAIEGHNEEVMKTIIDLEDVKVSGDADRIEFIRDTQIPYLEEQGFVHALGCEWNSLAFCYNRADEKEKACEAYRKAREILKPNNLYYAYSLSCEQIESLPLPWENFHRHHMEAAAYHLRRINGSLRLWRKDGYTRGKLYDIDHTPNDIIPNASRCDGFFTIPDGKVGDSITGSDGQILTFEADDLRVETPCGTFTNCQCYRFETATMLYRSYYKDGIGIVKQEKYRSDGIETRWLKTYTIVGGEGLLPCHAGNHWEYAAAFNEQYVGYESHLDVIYADETDVTLSFRYHTERRAFDENDWCDMHAQMRNEYFIAQSEKRRNILNDVSFAMERAETLADTPYRKAYTRAACGTMRRIFDTHPSNENRTQSNHWNFFSARTVRERDGDLHFFGEYFTHSFECKHTGKEVLRGPGYGVLFNDIYGILNQMAQALWSDKWVPGAEYTVTQKYFENLITTKIICTEAEEAVSTQAGHFENCFKLTIHVSGCGSGVEYRGGTKEYFFAPEVGLVRVINYYRDNEKKTTYDLTAYRGVGKGYMPMSAGMVRRYEATDLTDGFIAWTEYAYEENDFGILTVITNRCGVRDLTV